MEEVLGSFFGLEACSTVQTSTVLVNNKTFSFFNNSTVAFKATIPTTLLFNLKFDCGWIWEHIRTGRRHH